MENRGASRRSTKKILNIHINSVLNKHERDSAITKMKERDYKMKWKSATARQNEQKHYKNNSTVWSFF